MIHLVHFFVTKKPLKSTIIQETLTLGVIRWVNFDARFVKYRCI